MSSREIVLWLDERWYDALERHIKGESLQEKLEDYLDELCNNLLPDYEYEQISKDIYKEHMEREAQRETDRRFAVFRVTEHGEQSCFLVEQPINLLSAARSMRNYIQAENPSTDFGHYCAAAREITPDEFNAYTQERCEHSGRVTGAFEIDLGEGTFSSLDAGGGWSAYSIKAVSTAVYKATRKQGMSDAFYQARLAEELAGKELATQTQPAHNMDMGLTLR